MTLEKFIGPVLINDRFAINGRSDEDFDWIWEIDPLEYLATWIGDSGYSVRPLPDCEPEGIVILTDPENVTCGFYMDAQVWIDPDHRGRRLSIPMILEAARILGGSPVRDNDGCAVGFSLAGYSAHKAAHAYAVITAANAKTRARSKI